MTATDGTTSISYTYDHNGIRTSKTVDGVVHTYYYASGKLLRETYGSNILDFFYDASGTPYALKYNNGTNTTTYYYITNLQGDVIRLVDCYGNTAAQYTYDPYGNIVSSAGSHAEINPLRYRGYYFDQETQMYYLQSRYYDPALGRFINADAYTSTGQGMLSNNMFAYCGNNSVNAMDSSGNAFIGIGAQFELSVGSYSCGVEVIIYWDETVCNGGGPVIAVYIYEGASFSISQSVLQSAGLWNIIEQLTLAVAANAGNDYDTLALIELQDALFGSDASGSVLGIWGYDNFNSTDDYTGQFTSYSGNISHVKGTYSYSDTCWAVAIGGTTGSAWSLSFGQTYYTEIYSGTLFQLKSRGGTQYATIGNSRLCATYMH